MTTPGDAAVLAHTASWIHSVVIALGLCPFAQREVDAGRVRYTVSRASGVEDCLHRLADELRYLDGTPEVETTLLILPDAGAEFDDYLDLVALGDALLADIGYRGTYQLASFHPRYRFAGVDPDDAANFTNRSPWPMLHLLREASVERALARYPGPERIPARNIEITRALGGAALQARLNACIGGEKTDP